MTTNQRIRVTRLTRKTMNLCIDSKDAKEKQHGAHNNLSLMNHHQRMMTAETAGGWNILKETFRRTHVEAV